MSKIKTVLISGSPRRKGNTNYALERCAESLNKENVETEIISLAGKEIKSCVACYSCRGTGKCVLKDSFNEIADKVREAQGLIVGAPVYFGTARGDLMNLVQRLGMVSRGHDKFLSWMVGGPISVGRRGGLSTSYQEMLMFYFINEMIVPGADYWNFVFAGMEEESAKDDSEGINNIMVFGKNVGKLINKIN